MRLYQKSDILENIKNMLIVDIDLTSIMITINSGQFVCAKAKLGYFTTTLLNLSTTTKNYNQTRPQYLLTKTNKNSTIDYCKYLLMNP